MSALLAVSVAVLAPLAEVVPSPSPVPGLPREIDPARVTPGLLGLAAIVFLAVAVFVIWRSMNRQIKRIEFDDPTPSRRTVIDSEHPQGPDAD